jgi:myo-inositol 2-dehydrogenase / D-chiro-inositol 1-dehydrogenase
MPHQQLPDGYDQRVELMGSTGMVISDNRKPHEVRRYSAKSTEGAAPYQFFFLERYLEAFMAEIDGFVDCVEKGTPPLASFEDGRRALILAEAAYRSMHEKRLVNVSEISG